MMSNTFSRAVFVCIAIALALITAQGCSGEADAEAGAEVNVGVAVDVGVGVDVCMDPGGCGLDVEAVVPDRVRSGDTGRILGAGA